MRVTFASNPLIGELEELPRPHIQPVRTQELPAATRPVDRVQTVAYLCKAIVVVAGVAMTYCVISYGRIFENYLQW